MPPKKLPKVSNTKLLVNVCPAHLIPPSMVAKKPVPIATAKTAKVAEAPPRPLTLTASLNYSKFDKKDIFCQLEPCAGLYRKYTLSQFNDLLSTLLGCRVVTERKVISNEGRDDEVWGCSIKDYERLRSALPVYNTLSRASSAGTSGVPFNFIRLPANVRYAAQLHQDELDIPVHKKLERKERLDKAIVERIGETLWNKARDFQKDGARFCISLEGKAIIADAMGLGKTIQAMMVMSYYKEDWPCLIIAPSKCKAGWMVELVTKLGISVDDIEQIGNGNSLKAQKPRKEKKRKARAIPLNERYQLVKHLKVSSNFLEEEKSMGFELTDEEVKSLDTLSDATASVSPESASESDAADAAENSPWIGWYSQGKMKLPHFTIVSYDIVALHLDVFKGRGYKAIVVDEAHLTKNSESKRSRCVGDLVTSAKRSLLMSGTLLSKTKEVFPAVSALRPDLFPDFYAFGNRYCDPKTKSISFGGNQRDITTYDGRMLANELHAMLSILMMVRRGKEYVKLPPKKRTLLMLSPDSKRLKLAEKHAAKIDLSKITVDEELKEDFGKNNSFLQAIRKICTLKLPYVERYLESVLQPLGPNATPEQFAAHPFGKELRDAVAARGWYGGWGMDGGCLQQRPPCQGELHSPSPLTMSGKTNDLSPAPSSETKRVGEELPPPICPLKILLFGHHKEMLDAMDVLLQRMKIGFIRIDGSVSKPEKVLSSLNNFQNNPLCRVALLSITCAGAGITLTAGTVSIFLETHPSSIAVMQSEDRTHRIGQTLPCHCQYVIFPGSVEEMTWMMQNKKSKTMTSIVDGKAKGLKSDRILEDDLIAASVSDFEVIQLAPMLDVDDDVDEED
jgi:SNF2 family DNA or RNA helicase